MIYEKNYKKYFRVTQQPYYIFKMDINNNNNL